MASRLFTWQHLYHSVLGSRMEVACVGAERIVRKPQSDNPATGT